MFPVYKLLWERAAANTTNKTIEVKWISSAQHNDMLKDLEDFFKVKPDHYFSLEAFHKSEDRRLGNLAAVILDEATKLFVEERPDLVFIQGDTLTSQQCALAAFYEKIPIAHIEAGIRTNNINAPFPEELARRIISQVADLNFAPGERSLTTLEAEKILFKKNTYNFYTGNTVVDTLDLACKKIEAEDFDWSKFATAKLGFEDEDFNLHKYLQEPNVRKRILVTAHRRESHEFGIENLCNAIHRIAERFNGTEEVEFIICLHKNPNARFAFRELFEKVQKEKLDNIAFMEALNYPLFLELMLKSYFIVSDSGGIQEEAPYLNKPVLVARNETERTEGIDFGFSKLVGTDEHLIHASMLELISDREVYLSMIKEGLQPYGDGLAASRIVDISLLYLQQFEEFV